MVLACSNIQLLHYYSHRLQRKADLHDLISRNLVLTHQTPAQFLCTVNSLSQPKYLTKSHLYRCTTPSCRRKSFVFVDIFSTSIHTSKRDEFGKTLLVSIASKLHEVDLKCYNCGSLCDESIPDRCFSTEIDASVCFLDTTNVVRVSLPLLDIQVGDTLLVTGSATTIYPSLQSKEYGYAIKAISVQQLIKHGGDLLTVPDYNIRTDLYDYSTAFIPASVLRSLSMASVVISSHSYRNAPAI